MPNPPGGVLLHYTSLLSLWHARPANWPQPNLPFCLPFFALPQINQTRQTTVTRICPHSSCSWLAGEWECDKDGQQRLQPSAALQSSSRHLQRRMSSLSFLWVLFNARPSIICKLQAHKKCLEFIGQFCGRLSFKNLLQEAQPKP